MNYYSIPIKVAEIISGQRKNNEKELRAAIHQNIYLILKSFSLSYRFDPTFGSVMNKFHARTPPQRVSDRIWREDLRESIQNNLKDMLQRYETRIKIKDLIIDMEHSRVKNNPVVHVRVQLSGQLAIGRKEGFHFPDSEVAEEAMEVFPLMIPVGKINN